jgi:hypothetical protein
LAAALARDWKRRGETSGGIPADQFAQGGIGGGETRQFGTVRDAVRFIMEDVRNADRATAWMVST